MRYLRRITELIRRAEDYLIGNPGDKMYSRDSAPKIEVKGDIRALNAAEEKLGLANFDSVR